MPGSKILLDDEGFELLGNALALSYVATMVLRRQRLPSKEEKRKERQEYTERKELREVLELSGSYDYRLSHPNGYWGDKPLSIADYDSSILQFLAKNEELSNVRLKDFDVPPDLAKHYGIEASLRTADPFDRRAAISRLSPNELTRAYRQLVLDYFQDRIPGDLRSKLPGEDTTPAQSGQDLPNDASGNDLRCEITGGTLSPDGAHESNSASRRYNEGFASTDIPFVQEGVEMVKGGLATSAREASRRLVEKYGMISPQEWEDGMKEIRTNSPQNTMSRLAGKISKALKQDG